MKVQKIDKSLYYDPKRIVEKDRMLNFICGGTGIGKTYGFKKMAMLNFIDNGEQFMFWRRNERNFRDIDNFFEPFKCVDDEDKRLTDGWEVSHKGCCFKYKGKVAGYYRPLGSLQQKGSEFPNVGIIIFDEFIKHLGFERYLDNEFNCFLGAIDAVCRYKNEVKVYCLSNAVSLYNPYFLEIGYIYDGKEFWCPKSKDGKGLANDSCVQFIKEAPITKALSETRFGRLISGTSYGGYALNSESLIDTGEFIKKKGRYAQLIIIIEIDGIDYGVWQEPSGDLYVSKSVGNRDCAWYSNADSVRKAGYYTIRGLKNTGMWPVLVQSYDIGHMFFEDQQCKSAGISLMKEGFRV